ncbi:BRI1 kinase inhibitor 1 [Malania oleifera]|uniref:BRI1 kinase inhibitor 1 n=1 Tax=Malania oleifera TaxID=397392 RepID=UPI0025AE4465|nr:BRI1 kinase inhibitor 1 [Malania oleifera]
MDAHHPQQLKSIDDTAVPSKPLPESLSKPEPREDRPHPTPSPPSPSSSPSHEFSFTVSLHHSSAAVLDKTKPSPSPAGAVDLSPADDIFFHGHLLPLRLLSHLPVSPRSSTNSLDSFTLPIKDLSEDPNSKKTNDNCSSCSSSSNSTERKERSKSSKSHSLFGKWRKGCEANHEKEETEKKEKKRKIRFDVGHVLKRYVRMVRPLLSFRGRKEGVQIRRQPHSFSGNLTSLRPMGALLRSGRRGEFSAPASMRTSPTNSGLLMAKATAATLPSSVSDSTMEELQAAIQAAIAHCKNSIAVEEKSTKPLAC